MGQEDISQDSTDSAKNSKDAFFDPKPKPKMIRVLTVLAYVLSVSMAAIFLSIYYIFMWHGEPHLGAYQTISYNYSNRTVESDFGLNFSQPNIIVIPRPSARKKPPVITIANETNNDYMMGVNITEDVYIYNGNTTKADMQQQFTALEEEVRLSAPTPSEDNTTAWQDDYNDSFEDLQKSTLIKKLWDRNRYEENY